MVDLLKKIQDEAIDGNSDLASLLRRCQVLAARLNNLDLRRWVSCELDGYPQSVELPSYRVVCAESFGEFESRFTGTVEHHMPIPPRTLPQDIANSIRFCRFEHGVGALQQLLRDFANEENVCLVWPGDSVDRYSKENDTLYLLRSARIEIPKLKVVAILETVRNRVLDFSLKIGEELGDDDDEISEKSISPETVQNTYNTYILGDGNRVAAGCGPVEQNVTKFEKGNWAYLEGVLKQLKVAQDDITDLKQLLKTNPPKSKSKLGDGVNGWLGGIVAKAAQAGYDIPIGIGLAAILKYCGLN